MKKINNENNETKKIKFSKEKGSITIFVLLAMIFFVVILSGAYISSLNKQKSTLKNVEEIADNYEVEEDEYEGIYAKLENMAASGAISQEQYEALLNEVQKNNEALIAKISELETNNNNLATEVNNLNTQLSKMHPVGSVYTTSTNTNPATLLGVGTWTLTKKRLSSESWYETSYTAGNVFIPNTDSISSYTCSVVREGSNITFSLSFTASVDLADATVVIGTIDYSKIGITRVSSAPRMVAWNDGANGVCFVGMNATSGEISIGDIIAKSGVSSLTAGNGTFVFSTSVTVIDNYKNDSACNEFVWERTQ